LESSIPYALENFIQRTLDNSKNQNLALKDLISNPLESLNVRNTKKQDLLSIPTSYFQKSKRSKFKGRYGINYSDFSSKQQDSSLPLYRLNLVTSDPEGGSYKIGLQLGTIDAGQRSDYSTPVKRDLDAEARLAQQLTDLFQAVASYGQPKLNK
jgi:hypothetical protein